MIGKYGIAQRNNLQPMRAPAVASSPAARPAAPLGAQNYAGSWGDVFGAIGKAQASGLQGNALMAKVQDLNDAGLGTKLRSSARSPFAHLMTFNDRAYATGWGAPYTSPYQSPAGGGQGPGGAMAGMGQGATNGNPFDINAPGAGLWSAGYNPNDAGNVENLYWKIAMDPNATRRPELSRFYNTAPGTRLGTNDLNAFLGAADWYYRNQARTVDKDNNFLNTIPGKLLAAGLTAGVGSIATPLGIAAGAGFGGAQGGWKGALLGGAAGAVAPSLKLPGFGAAVRAPMNALSSVAKQFSNPLTATRFVASQGIGSMVPRRNA